MLERFAQSAESRRDLLRGRWLAAAGAIFSALGGAVLAAWFAGRPSFGSVTATGLFLAAIVLGVLATQAFYHLDGLYEQRGRDVRAQKLWQALDEGTPPPEPFVLYLRPFASTDQIDEVSARAISVGGGAGVVISTDRLEFEEQIERALRPMGLLIGLGRPLEHFGAGRIPLTDENWQAAILNMMQAAQLIVLLPSPRGGTIWEVEQILTRGLLSKTIVIDPPNDEGARRRDYDPASEWAFIKAAFESRGFQLPADNPDGQMLYFGDSAEPEQVAGISLGGAATVRRFARHVIKESAGEPAAA